MHPELNILLRALVAIILCGLLGWEREAAGKSAGIRTHMLIGLASALFVAIAELLVTQSKSLGVSMHTDPVRVMEAVVTGVSFLGAGTIFFARGGNVQGLTTAAGILVTAAVGMMVGMQFYLLAVGTTLLTFLVLFVMGWVRDKPAAASVAQLPAAADGTRQGG
ncbi:MAG: MgtC/SapB family protein [Verrucomicrobiales bacterium]|nr:MgtC/SapB family protein [Verrucomicrobiales bacterium]